MDEPKAFQTYDIRGKYPQEVNEELALGLGKSVGTFAKNIIVVGGDNNYTTNTLKFAFISGALSIGVDVIDVGLGTSDMIAFGGKYYNADLSVMITASHIGIDKNGFKFFYTAGNEFINEDLENIKGLYLNKNFRKIEQRKIGKRINKHKELYNSYLNTVMKHFKSFFTKIDSKVKVIVDIGDGTASITTPILLQKLGVEVIKVNSDIDGGFRRQPENVEYLADKIKEYNADVAIAHDIDADRISAFDKNGRRISGDELFCLFAEIIVKEGDKVIASVDTSRVLNDVCKGEIVYTRIGDPFVIDAAIKHNAILAGEPNGHYCYPPFIAYNSGTFFALLLSAIAENIPPNIKKLPKYCLKTKKFKVDNKREKMNEIIRTGEEKYKIISRVDGIKFECGKSEVLIRPSGTEPVIRIVVESKNDTNSKNVLDKLEKMFFKVKNVGP
jgi:phosphomannomutase/phosphoglucomutase